MELAFQSAGGSANGKLNHIFRALFFVMLGHGRVNGEAQICDLAVIAEDAHIGGRTIVCIVCGDEIVSGEACGPVEPPRAAVTATGTIRFVRQML